MKICVFGAGAIGSNLAVRLLQGEENRVSVVGRGEHLRAIQSGGLVLDSPLGRFSGRPYVATDDPGTLEPQDVVFVTLKTWQQAPAAVAIDGLLGKNGIAVFVANGIPWWWKFGRSGAEPLKLLDPKAELWTKVRPERVLGCTVYSANEILAPGIVRHKANDRWVLGEPCGGYSARVGGVVDLLKASGIGAEFVSDIRNHIWSKLLRNAPLNAVCALAHCSIDDIAENPDLLLLVHQIIDEVALVASSQGEDISALRPAAREAPSRGGALAGPAAKGVKPSMLQDIENGRPTEVESILGQVHDFAQEAGLSCPALEVVTRLMRARNLSILRDGRFSSSNQS
jgi:2-dehydropantoate 2-reductase